MITDACMDRGMDVYKDSPQNSMPLAPLVFAIIGSVFFAIFIMFVVFLCFV